MTTQHEAMDKDELLLREALPYVQARHFHTVIHSTSAQPVGGCPQCELNARITARLAAEKLPQSHVPVSLVDLQRLQQFVNHFKVADDAMRGEACSLLTLLRAAQEERK
jgi:hypothetical protein